MKFFLLLLCLSVSLLSSACNDEEEEVTTYNIRLTVRAVNVTDAALNLHLDRQDRGKEFLVKQNGNPISGGTVGNIDTVIVAESLLPKCGYSFRAYAVDHGREIDSSNLLAITTMDTTSHDIVWTIDTFGDGNSSMLNDVFILNDTCAFAVGEIYIKDSLSQYFGSPYNFMLWNGKTWTMKKAYPRYKGVAVPIPLTGVYAFSPTDIWLTGSFPIHGDGEYWTIWQLNDLGLKVVLEKCWGRNSQDMYFVGWSGSMVHYDGVKFTQLASGTDMEIQDIYGGQNSTTGQWEILAAAGDYFASRNSILNIEGDSVNLIARNDITGSLYTVWFIPGRCYWAAGGGVYQKPYSLEESSWRGGAHTYTDYFTNKIRGTNANDIFICGAFGDIVHFNGISTRNYHDQVYLSNGTFYGVAVSKNLVIAVGENNPRAILAMGRRK